MKRRCISLLWPASVSVDCLVACVAASPPRKIRGWRGNARRALRGSGKTWLCRRRAPARRLPPCGHGFGTSTPARALSRRWPRSTACRRRPSRAACRPAASRPRWRGGAHRARTDWPAAAFFGARDADLVCHAASTSSFLRCLLPALVMPPRHWTRRSSARRAPARPMRATRRLVEREKPVGLAGDRDGRHGVDALQAPQRVARWLPPGRFRERLHLGLKRGLLLVSASADALAVMVERGHGRRVAQVDSPNPCPEIPGATTLSLAGGVLSS